MARLLKHESACVHLWLSERDRAVSIRAKPVGCSSCVVSGHSFGWVAQTRFSVIVLSCLALFSSDCGTGFGKLGRFANALGDLWGQFFGVPALIIIAMTFYCVRLFLHAKLKSVSSVRTGSERGNALGRPLLRDVVSFALFGVSWPQLLRATAHSRQRAVFPDFAMLACVL